MSASAAAAAAPSGVAYVKIGAELEFGRIWSSIMAVMADSQHKLVLFASPGRGQGTSTMAAGVALTAAQANAHLRLGLLDANFRAPSLEKIFQIPATPGVADAVAGATDAAELGYSVGVHANLTVIPAGKVDADPLSLLRQDRIGTLLSGLISRFDFLFIDTAPVNQYPDAQLLAAVTDATVLVVDVGRTPRESVAKAKQILQTGHANLLGTVLNRRSQPVPGVFYGRA